MPCACGQKRQMFEVVLNGGSGKVAWAGSSQPTAVTIAKGRYSAANAVVRDKKTGRIVWPPSTTG